MPVGGDLPSIENEISFYKERAEQAPSDGLDLASLAEAFLTKGRLTGDAVWFRRAEEAARKSITNAPHDNPGPWVTLATLAHMRHDFLSARMLIDTALADKPGDPEALSNSIIVYLGVGDVVAAAAEADHFLDMFPTSHSFTLHALVMEAQGRHAEAEFDFREAIKKLESGIDPAWPRTLFGRFLARRGRSSEAREMFSKALNDRPGYHLALYELGRLESDEGILENAFERMPLPRYLFEQSRAIRTDGDIAKADQIRSHAEFMLRKSLATDSLAHRSDLAELLLDRGEAAEAFELMRAEAGARRDARTLMLLSESLHQLGRFREARMIIQEALRTGVKQDNIFLLAGRIEESLGNAPRAKIYFDAVPEKEKNVLWFFAAGGLVALVIGILYRRTIQESKAAKK